MTRNNLSFAFLILLVCGLAYGVPTTLADCTQVQGVAGIKSFEMEDGFGSWTFKTVPSDRVQVLYSGLDPEIAKKFLITNSNGEFKISIKESYSMINGKIYFGQGSMNICSRGGGAIISAGSTISGNICIINGEVLINGRRVEPSTSGGGEGYDISQFKVFVSLPENLSSYRFTVGVASANVTGPLKGNTEISISGSGIFSADSVEATNLKAKITGAGAILVKAGQVETLKSKISGSGRATFGTAVTDLDAKILGSGQINVDGVVNGGSTKITGSGSISVRKVSGYLKQKTTGSGRIRVLEK